MTPPQRKTILDNLLIQLHLGKAHRRLTNRYRSETQNKRRCKNRPTVLAHLKTEWGNRMERRNRNIMKNQNR